MKNTGLLNEKYKGKVDNLPFFMKYVVNALLECIDNIVNGNCDEETIVSTMATLENNANGRYCKEDLLNYDKAGEILGFGCTNRVGLKRLLDKNNIHQVVINNIKCGFKRSEIMALRDKLKEDVAKREIKKRQKEQRAFLKKHAKEYKERGYS